MKDLYVVLLAAGKGTRMRSELPKVLHLVDNIPMIVHVINTAKRLIPKSIITIIGHQYKLVESTLKEYGLNFIHQLDQLGTGHAIEQCRNFFNKIHGDILILSGDVPLISFSTISTLLEEHKRRNADATLLTADFEDPSGYGRIVRDNYGFLDKVIEDKDAIDKEKEITEINAGIYVFDCNTLFSELKKINNNNLQGEYYLPDVLPLIIKNKGKVAIVKTQKYYEIQGVNTEKQLREINKIYENNN